MKIIFDSEEQKENFARHIFADHCPTLFGLNGSCCDFEECDECWKNCGLEVEVKNERF